MGKRKLLPKTLSHRMMLAGGFAVADGEAKKGPRTVDAFGFGDLIAVRPVETILIQSTDTTNFSKRLQKMWRCPDLGLWIQGSNNFIELHGWYDDHTCRVVSVEWTASMGWNATPIRVWRNESRVKLWSPPQLGAWDHEDRTWPTSWRRK